MEDIIDADHRHTKRVCKNFETENLGEYESDTLLSADVFQNFLNMCLEMYELEPVAFFITS